ncbi:MAG: hypothetical protein C0613_05725 [Desulfobulbaceae bacterium]|nr:MAG: hypothetical protein C0613_05725 [Desulfobulbaceae bacterium]
MQGEVAGLTGVYNRARYCAEKILTTYFLLPVAFLCVLPIRTKKQYSAIATRNGPGPENKIEPAGHRYYSSPSSPELVFFRERDLNFSMSEHPQGVSF